MLFGARTWQDKRPAERAGHARDHPLAATAVLVIRLPSGQEPFFRVHRASVSGVFDAAEGCALPANANISGGLSHLSSELHTLLEAAARVLTNATPSVRLRLAGDECSLPVKSCHEHPRTVHLEDGER